ncbi:MAG: hypothetical protein NTZ59_15495 [Bacteroidetes bacterium]|nr:hypothetical protein [Bacteroidota bacterium]
MQLEIDDTIKNLKPGTKDWLKQMVLNFQYGYDLPAYSDEYDNTGLSQTEIENSRIVKYCAVDDKGDIEVVKVAASNGSDLIPLTTPQLAALQAYIQKIKYGGVFITVVNEVADSLKYTATVYYNPMLIDNNGVEISTGVTTTKNAIDTHLKSLEFNGVFSPQALQDSLQKVNGVVFITPSLIQVKADAAAAYENVETYYVPASGYLRFINPTHLTLNFLPYVNY